ncbi:MAG: hypothetical protein KC543_15685 [Myxococcales bacterium]|nr:hypothetical protein [Myxococcales bacterium]
MSGAAWARAGRWLAIAGIFLAVVVVRVVVGGHNELEQAKAFDEAGKVVPAIVHYRRAARWYAPGSPYPVEALDRLAALGQQLTAQGDVQGALGAWRAVRGSILATRSFYTPHPERLEVANHHIAELMASEPPPPIDAGKSKEELTREHLALLEHVPEPKLGWTLVLLFGFFMWVFGAFRFSVRAVDQDDRLVGAQALRWGGVVVVGFALFVLGMWLA